MSDDLASAIRRHLTDDGQAVIVPARVAAWLERHAATGEARMRVRVGDQQAYACLAALHLVALQHRSDSGTESTGEQRVTAPSTPEWLSTNDAAKALGVTDRCVRGWAASGRLRAIRVGGRWAIARASIAAVKGTN